MTLLVPNNSVFLGPVLIALLNSCVCFVPVDENPDFDAGRDAAVQLPVTSFIAPVPLEDLADVEAHAWPFPVHDMYMGIPPRSYMGAPPQPWRHISWSRNGELVIDAVAGFVLPDAGYVSIASEPWLPNRYDAIENPDGWFSFDDEWYRYSYYNISNIGPYGPLYIWRVARPRTPLSLETTLTSQVDGGDWFQRQLVSVVAVWGGSHLWLFDRIWDMDSQTHLRGRVSIATSLDTLSTAQVIDSPLRRVADGVDGDTRLVWASLQTTSEDREVLLRFRGDEVSDTTIDAGDCNAPYVQAGAPITVGCFSDGGLDVWIADREGARIIGREELAPETRTTGRARFLATLQPLRMLFQHRTDAGAVMLNICTSERCEERLETFSAPLNAGVDDAGALYIADYLLDAGVRVTRFAPDAW